MWIEDWGFSNKVEQQWKHLTLKWGKKPKKQTKMKIMDIVLLNSVQEEKIWKFNSIWLEFFAVGYLLCCTRLWVQWKVFAYRFYWAQKLEVNFCVKLFTWFFPLCAFSKYVLHSLHSTESFFIISNVRLHSNEFISHFLWCVNIKLLFYDLNMHYMVFS